MPYEQDINVEIFNIRWNKGDTLSEKLNCPADGSNPTLYDITFYGGPSRLAQRLILQFFIIISDRVHNYDKNSHSVLCLGVVS